MMIKDLSIGIATASLEVLRAEGRAVTIAVFRQLPVHLEIDEIRFAGGRLPALLGRVNYHWGCRHIYDHEHAYWSDCSGMEHVHALWVSGEELRHVIFRETWCVNPAASDEEYDADPAGCFHRMFADVRQLFIAAG